MSYNNNNRNRNPQMSINNVNDPNAALIDRTTPNKSYSVNLEVNTTNDGDHLSDDPQRPHSNDPLVMQLPRELWPYVKVPEQNQARIVRVSRAACYAAAHAVCAVLSVFCCCYGLCRTVVVRQGQIALTQNQDKPEILGPGRHVLLSPFNRLIQIRNETDPIIDHGPIKIIKVQSGQLGYGVDMQTGEPTLLTQGTHAINSTTFRWMRFITLREARTRLENLEIIRVETGNVAYAYVKGKLVILQPGLHLIRPPDRFGNIITTQMTILDLPLQVHETSDYVPLQIKAAVFYRVVDPLKALVRIQNVHKQIEETSIATLAGIIRGSSLSDVASRSQPFYHKTGKEKQEQEQEAREQKSADDNQQSSYQAPRQISVAPSAPPFFQHVHDEFVSQLHDHVYEEWGVEIQNIRIESLKINDPRLQSDISAQAIEVSKIHNKFLMLQKKQDITVVEAETRATKVRIDTDAEAMLIRTRAQARADAVIIQAKADKSALELRGQGEAEYSRLLESTRLGRELAQMKVQAQAIAGIRQIAYVPHLPSMLAKNGVFADSTMVMPLANSRELDNNNNNNN